LSRSAGEFVEIGCFASIFSRIALVLRYSGANGTSDDVGHSLVFSFLAREVLTCLFLIGRTPSGATWLLQQLPSIDPRIDRAAHLLGTFCVSDFERPAKKTWPMPKLIWRITRLYLLHRRLAPL
jgi:hypothetical protein